MTSPAIHKLLAAGFPENTGRPGLVETHISWVILCDHFVYKIKKPVHYSFLDFSTPEKRKYYCEREVLLNRRLTEGIYLDVQPVRQNGEYFLIGDGAGTAIDHAVRMRKMDRGRQMDVLLSQGRVTPADIWQLAEKIATFHRQTDVIYEKDFLDIGRQFNDLAAEADFMDRRLADSGRLIREAVETSDAFIEKHRALLAQRLEGGFFRDCHGDLHSRNIFLLSTPQPFDCIEFNDHFRQTDVLNEVAFLCMDLDSLGRPDLSDQFLYDYAQRFPVLQTPEDRLLFIYYKSYRANIRAKVNSLRARSAETVDAGEKALREAGRYLHLMDDYLELCRRSD